MRKRPAFAMLVLTAILTLSIAVPATAAPRLRLYVGQTSQAKKIVFAVAKKDAGRFLKGFTFSVTLTCDDATTQDFWLSFYWHGGLPLTDGVFVDRDDVSTELAVHLHGRIGQHRGSGTLKATIPALTVDEQPQLCTSGDMTWQVEYNRTLSLTSSVSRPALDGVMKVRVAPDGEVSTRVRNLG